MRADSAGPGGPGQEEVQVLAFYLPQYHRVPDNDRWWGPGYTDWERVLAARPRFPGHGVPHRPGELGTYDLLDPRTLPAQAELAEEHKIGGFVYYHYWSLGRLLLEAPAEGHLRRRSVRQPFALCWANESWTDKWGPTYGSDPRLWTGQRHLFEQRYSREDDISHFRYLARFLADDRYLKVRGRPLLIIWRTADLPNLAATAETWRGEAHRLGLGEIYLCGLEVPGRPYDQAALDAVICFEPSRSRRAATGLRPYARSPLGDLLYDYQEQARHAIDYARGLTSAVHPCVFPAWDNSPRRAAGATIYTNSEPAAYGRWLGDARQIALRNPSTTPPLVFINAWNEWAEGCHLEPDANYGRSYLTETRRIIDATRNPGGANDQPPYPPG
jgi:O-antigen biosynthesis protein